MREIESYRIIRQVLPNNMTIATVKRQLKNMVHADQEARKSFPVKQGNIDELTKKHTEAIKKIITEFGVIDLDRFDENAARNAAIIVQHSPLPIKELYLQLQEEFDQQKIFKRGYAYLKDRVLISKGEKQLFGTQLKVLNEAGDMAVNPIEDMDNLDKRREEMGLEPFVDYLQVIEKNTGKKPIF